MKRTKLRASVRLRVYDVISGAVEAAVPVGYRRAHKHTDKPSEEAICADIHRAVMERLGELIDFDQEGA